MKIGWWHHFMLAGACTLLWDVTWFNAAGGSAFGVGLAWWILGSAYRHDLKSWLTR